ncbi:MAG: hypothetical protein U1F87_04280 [Kiritimatiellia bacterium]
MITFFWGATDGGATTNWAHQATLPGVHSAGYALPVRGLPHHPVSSAPRAR